MALYNLLISLKAFLMGIMKAYYQELQERSMQGRSDMGEKYPLCFNCIVNDGIKIFIKNKNNKGVCHYCKKNGFIAKLGDIIDHVHNCIRREFVCLEEGCSKYGIWDSENKEYLNISFTDGTPIEDILDELGLECDSEDIKEAICEGLEDYWYRREVIDWGYPIGDTYARWERFKSIIQTKCRFFFKDYVDKGENYLSTDKPSSILNTISKWLDAFSLDYLIKENTVLYRARVFPKNSEQNLDKKNLGPPPSENIRTSSRMSPDGIPIFYLSLDKKTAIYETYFNNKNKLVVSRWKIIKSIKVIDLTKISTLPCIDFFHEEEKFIESHYAMIFLKSFSDDISKPIKKDDLKHLEYIPSQIVSEFIKFYRKEKGMIYKSSKSNDGKNLALFFNAYNYQEYLEFLDYKTET